MKSRKISNQFLPGGPQNFMKFIFSLRIFESFYTAIQTGTVQLFSIFEKS
jgi:hypothetical protein